MSKYPLIEAMGLTVFQVEANPNEWIDPKDKIIFDYVSAASLEKALQDSPVVWGSEKSDSYFMPYLKFDSIELQDGSNAIKGRLVCIQPLKKKTKKEAALEFLEKFLDENKRWSNPEDAAKDAKEILEMPE
jgi:hypothetical protein